jgi:HK97 family phage major capsid protein
MKILFSLFMLIATALAAVHLFRLPAAPRTEAPVNHATLQLTHLFRTLGRYVAFGLVRAKQAVDAVFGLRMPFALGITGDELNQKLLDSLTSIEQRVKKVDDIESQVKKGREDYDTVTKLLADVQKDMLDVRKLQLELRSSAGPRRKGEVSEACAKWLGALAVRGAIEQGKIGDESRAKSFQKIADEIIGKTAVSSSDIPLPTQYSGEVVELVSAYGAARRYGTVFPLGSGVVKLPKLTTDPTFGLIAASGSVGEKVPQVAWVTFTAEKFGGIVRLPSEIDEDSIVAVGQFVARYAARQMAYIEDWNFFCGTGGASGVNGTAKGLVTTVVDDSKTVALASTKTHYSDVTLAKMRELRTSVDAAALGMSAYYLHPTFEQALAGMNTSGDKPYIANGINGASLDGFPIRWVDVLPAYSTGSNTSKVFALFGDVSYQYLGLRGGMRFDVSRDVYFATDEIGIRALERLTTGKMATGAVGGLITAAS